MLSPKAELLLRAIEAAGYRVRGYHDAINDSRGPLIITATSLSSGETFTAQDANGDEYAALNQLVLRLGLDTDPTDGSSGRGRDTGHPAPPAQIRT